MYKNKSIYENINLFIQIMRSGSFQKAADEAGISVSSLGKIIEQIESELGIHLFEKQTDGMVPTAAGLYLYDKMDVVLWNLDTAFQQAKNIPAEDSMKISIGIYDMISGSAYRELIHTYNADYPLINLTMTAPAEPEMRRKLLDGSLDAAIVYSVGINNEPGLVRKSLFRSKPCVYYHRSLIGDKMHSEDLDLLREYPFVCLNTEMAAMNMLRDLPFEPKRVYYAENLRALQLYVSSGIACTVLGASQQMHEMGGIYTITLDNAETFMGIDLVWLKNNSNPALALLLNLTDRIAGR